MKNTKAKILSTIVVTLLATLLFCTKAFAAVTITFPTIINNGAGTISVSGNSNNDKIYYQAIVMTDSQYQTINQIENDITTAYNDYKARYDAKKPRYDELRAKVNAGTATEAEYQEALSLYNELQQMTTDYEQTRDSLYQRRENAFPRYSDSDWTEAVNGHFTINNTTSEDKYYVLWVKVGDTTDKMIYKVLGRANTTIPVKEISVEVGKTVELTGTDGTDLSTITWASDDSTIAVMENNKVKGLKVGATTIRGTRNGNEVIDISVIVRAASTTEQTKDIPSDAKGYNGHAYYYFSGNKSWDDAQAYCEKVGGHLVTITTEGEANFVKTLNGTSNAWIGGYKDSAWKWVTGEAWNYTNWNSNEPGSNDRAALVSGKWSTFENNSMEVAGFVCEWDDPEGLQPTDPSNPSDPTNPTNTTNTTDPSSNRTGEPEEQLIYRQDGIGGSTTNPNSTSGDQTIATKKIPQTGESILAIVAIVAVAGVTVIAFVNYRKNNK